MAVVWEFVRSSFWNEWFWLPANNTWNDFKNDKDDGIYRAQVSDMWVTLPLAVVLLVVRVLFERYIAAPIGRRFGLKDRKVKAPNNPYLENIFMKSKYPERISYENISKQTDLTVRQIERWFRLRRAQNRTIVLYRFTESCWRCLFYMGIFWFGVIVLWDKSWFWETIHCWNGYPHHHVSSGVYWYYALEGAFYISLVITLTKDVKRKDFVEMIIHHVATLSLMFMSWSQNLNRMGTLILLLHDAVDPWLEAAKMAKYLHYQKLCDSLFVVFLIVWIITRMILFPVRLIYTTMFESINIVGFCNIYYVYNVLLIILQILHIFWFTLISKIVLKALNKGTIIKDDRSSSEEDVSDEDDDKMLDSEITNNAVTSSSNSINGTVHISDNNRNKLKSRH